LLIIFDLDDTLVDTSGCITPFALKAALEAMIASGLSVPAFDAALEQLMQINRTAGSGGEALAEFVEILDGDYVHVETGRRKMCGEMPADLLLFPVDGAVEVLGELALDHELALVTIGNLPMQMEKLKKAGIDSAFFSNIIASEDRNKKLHYQGLLDKLNYGPHEVIVCGDRIALDLTPAKELGCKTVQIKWGRGLNVTGKKEDVDYQIKALRELKDIVTHLMTFSAF
jgi:FMN phosphatase YigB (HAD superfamily)